MISRSSACGPMGIEAVFEQGVRFIGTDYTLGSGNTRLQFNEPSQRCLRSWIRRSDPDKRCPYVSNVPYVRVAAAEAAAPKDTAAVGIAALAEEDMAARLRSL